MSNTHNFIKVNSPNLLSALGYKKGVKDESVPRHPRHNEMRGWKITFVGNPKNKSCFEFVEVYHSKGSSGSKPYSKKRKLDKIEQIHCDIDLRIPIGSQDTLDTSEGNSDRVNIIVKNADFFNKEMFVGDQNDVKPNFHFFFLEYGNFNETIKHCDSYYFSRSILNFGNSLWRNSQDGSFDVLKILCGGNKPKTIATYPLRRAESSKSRQEAPIAQPLMLIAPPCPPHWIPELLNSDEKGLMVEDKLIKVKGE